MQQASKAENRLQRRAKSLYFLPLIRRKMFPRTPWYLIIHLFTQQIFMWLLHAMHFSRHMRYINEHINKYLCLHKVYIPEGYRNNK